MNSPIVLLGGAGFIGSRLGHRLLRSGADFRVADKIPSRPFPDRSVSVDVRSVESLRAGIPPQAPLVNLAAEHRDDVRPVSLYHDVNVTGARNVCLVAEEKKVERIVFTSSVAVYGFAEGNTDENGAMQPFNDYGRTKAEAEGIYRSWQARDPRNRTLVIVRPTVVFGEQNRGNVYNLLRQIHSGRFLMIGSGQNQKSMAYVENVASFLHQSLSFKPGVHIYNYVDKPDLDMNSLVATVRNELGMGRSVGARVPYVIGYAVGFLCDLVAKATGRSFPISAIRVRKFTATTKFSSAATKTGFVAPVSLEEGIRRTVRYEFVEDHPDEEVYFSE